jgi:lysozyme family protein
VPAAAPAPPSPVPGPTPGQPSRFDLCLQLVLAKEGGFADDPADPGGATQMGITAHTLAAWRGRPVSVDEVRNLSRDEAKEIYRAQYWNLMRCEDLPRGVDLAVFDFGVNAGPGTAVKALQRAIGTTPDGAVGPFTLRAAQMTDARALIGAICQARLEFYRGLGGFARFGKGWISRVEDVRRQALLMVAA